MDLQRLQNQIDSDSDTLPPVEKWNPDFCGDIDLVIKHDGSWFYMGTPIGRKALVKLFASVLKKEGDNYFLVTPVEKVGITVEDSPFIVTQWENRDGVLVFETQTNDKFIVGNTHPILLRPDKVTGQTLPYANVRRNLWARLHQNVFYQMIETGRVAILDGQSQLVCSSGDYQFSLGATEQ